ncbi:endonuclease III [Candidatus Solincola tengchongensis]|uniref:endonuclease III domain-containing protein n=1 Tax=Candidatus Solincola tengchongensis TaxID=2900693 RepID=UPI00257B18B2|nr:endonuclease III [Candidatus Solincola tengchongensis]
MPGKERAAKRERRLVSLSPRDFQALRRRVERIDRALLECYGDRPWKPRFRHLLDGLVHTLLSQNTNDANSNLAFFRLKDRFPSWEEAARAPVEEIEEAIRPGGISRVKAERIKTILELVRRDFGAYCLAPLAQREPEEVLRYLLGLPGVGRKTAAILLLFQLGHPFFPVDTHVFRVGKRLEIIPAGLGPVAAHEAMDRLVPDGSKYRLHLNLVEHGRRACRARNPLCGDCCLRALCPYPERLAPPLR